MIKTKKASLIKRLGIVWVLVMMLFGLTAWGLPPITPIETIDEKGLENEVGNALDNTANPLNMAVMPLNEVNDVQDLALKKALLLSKKNKIVREPLSQFIPDLFLRPEITPEYIEFAATHEVKRGNPNTKAMALTFDCEGTFDELNEILTTLEANKARGTFFLEGQFVGANPGAIPLILSGEHELGNHSYNHARFTTISQTQVTMEVTRTEIAISAAAGRPLALRYFRFPYGARNAEIRRWVAEQGYQSVFWDIDPQGWRSSISATAVISRVIAQAHPGGIVLMHCSSLTDREALPDIIAKLQAMGYVLDSLTPVIKPD